MIPRLWLLYTLAGTVLFGSGVSSVAPGYATEAARPETSVPPKTKMALKLAGLISFVASSCPELQPDYDRFKGAIGALGVSTVDLERQELKATYLGYALRYKAEPATNCARALKDFGPGGGVIADLVKPKSR